MPLSRHRQHHYNRSPAPADGQPQSRFAANIAALPSVTASPLPGNENNGHGEATRPLETRPSRPSLPGAVTGEPSPDAGRDGRVSQGVCPPPPGSPPGQVGQAGRDFQGAHPAPEDGPIAAAAEYLAAYLVLPDGSALVIAAWVAAAWLQDQWDKFPHLAVTSPEKQCGKTTLLDLLYQIVPRPRYTTNISPAALYRVIERERPTLLMDESQSISRRGSEASEVIREILNAGIGRNAKVMRCGGERMDEIVEFSVYGPKVFAMIGEPDAVLADRCLPVAMRRKTKNDEVRRYRSQEVEEYGSAVRAELQQWAAEKAAEVAGAYATIEPFDIENDRMADLLTPLQAVLAVAAPHRLKELEGYANGLDERDREADRMEPGLRLLAACREILTAHREQLKCQSVFIPTVTLISELVNRSEEPWATYTRGHRITPEALATLLRKYDIRPELDTGRKVRGYVSARFEDAWARYLPPPSEIPSSPSSPRENGNGGLRGFELPPVKDAWLCTNNRHLRGPAPIPSGNGDGKGGAR